MALLPTRILEIEFDAGVWTDVTADMVTVETRRGRNRELGAFETGQFVFTLRNNGRKYDPDHTAGPYYGKLRPNRRVRFRATYNAVTYPIFVGYIDRIAQVSEGPNAAAAVFEASDLFKLLNRTELTSSVYAVELAADNPAAWFRLGEPSGAAAVSDSSGNDRTGAVNGPVQLGEASLTVRDDDTAARFNETGLTWIGPIAGPTFDQATPFAVEFWLNLDTAPTLLQLIVTGGQNHGDWGQRDFYALQPAGTPRYLNFMVGNSAGTLFQVNSPTLTLGTTYHVVITHDQDRVLRIYLNGSLAATGDTTTGTFTITHHRIGSDSAVQVSLKGVLDEYALYTAATGSALSTTRIAAHNTAGRTPWDDDLPGPRLGRILDEAGIPAADRDIDTGTTTLQSTNLGGTALAYAQKIEETELGWLFVTRDGKLRFIGRRAGQTGDYLTSQATLVDADSGAGLPYRSGDPDVDEQTIVTRATVSRDGSIAVTVYDQAAATEFGWLDQTHDGLLHDDDGYSGHYGEWILNTHKEPSSRLGTVELELTGDPTNLYPAILALELAERVTWKRKPQNTGSVVTLDMRVEAIEHETGGGYWRTRLQLSPINLGAGGLPVFVWGTTRWGQHVWGI